jgi:Methyltransferase domain
LLEHLLGNFEPVYRWLLRRKGAVAKPRPIAFASNPRVLRRRSEWEDASATLRAAGLHSHPDPQKNWDHLSALTFILEHASPRDRLLDAGGERYSPLVDWLFLYGFRDLHVVNLSFAKRFSRGPIRYIRGDCTKTPYAAESIRILTCLSVLEHGVPLAPFWAEASRIVTPGGFVLVSADFWCAPVAVDGLEAYGHPIRVFEPSGIREVIAEATKQGFTPVEPIDIRCEEKAIHWDGVGLDFTFIFLTFRKSPPVVRPTRSGPPPREAPQPPRRQPPDFRRPPQPT